MKYKVMPPLYAASENYKSTIRFQLELADEVDADALAYAAGQVQRRYPYFSVRLEREGEAYVLTDNDLPFVLSKENQAVCLGSAECNYHFLAFAYDRNLISIDISHFICDGNGVAPMVKTLAYYYIQKRYGDEDIDTSVVRLVTDEIPEEEYLYPFPEEPLPVNEEIGPEEMPQEAFQFGADYFDRGGVYAYHLQILQKDLVSRAKEDNGSPLTWVGVTLFKVINRLFPENQKDIVFLIPHDYRSVLGKPLSHDSLVRVMCTGLSQEFRNDPAKKLNPMLRGQLIRGFDESLDVRMVNWILQLDAQLEKMPLAAKRKMMQEVLAGLVGPCSVGISYTGNIAWGGMEKYISDVHVYSGEENMFGQVVVQIFTCGPYFSLTLMQPGENPAIARELIQCCEESGVPCTLRSEGRFRYPDFALPEEGKNGGSIDGCK